MNITFKATSNIENKVKVRPMSQVSPSHSGLSQFDNTYNKKRPLESNSQNLSFKGLSSIKVSDLVNSFRTEIGESAAKNLNNTIQNITSSKKPWATLANNEITFKPENIGVRIYQSIIDPIIHFPIDFANSTLDLINKIPIFKNSEAIKTALEKGPLKNRRDYLENFSATMAVQHHAELLKDVNGSQNRVFIEANNRFNPKVANYNSKSERTLTRVITGIIPAFFLANDAYNLSIYINNDKDLAKKEKKRRLNQEIARIAITAASTFAVLGFFAKRSNANPRAATTLIAATTLASEILGRIIAGTPFYPISKKGAQKYAKLQNKDKKENDKKEVKTADLSKIKSEKLLLDKPQAGYNKTSVNDKTKPKSDYALKLIGTLVLLGFGAEKLPLWIKPIRKSWYELTSKYNGHFKLDATITSQEFNTLMEKLEKKGFKELADNYRNIKNSIIKNGNLTVEESGRVDRKINEMIEEKTIGFKMFSEDSLKTHRKDIKTKYKEAMNKWKVAQELGIQKKSDDVIYLCGKTNKTKDIVINQVLKFPIKLVGEIVMMPYKYVIKPLYEMPKKLISKINPNGASPEKDKLSESEILKNGINFLKKNIDAPDFETKLNKNFIDAFDNVNKSNFSNAELSGSAKTAVSTVTSAFLIFDNYNMVMIDSEGKDKQLAGQKAKERTIQRIIRIAYGACIIKLFNGIFQKQYNSSLVGAQGVNILSTGIVETLERKSVGLPLHEASREEITENDRSNLNAEGFKGVYYRTMAKLTGKKSFADMQADKK